MPQPNFLHRGVTQSEEKCNARQGRTDAQPEQDAEKRDRLSGDIIFYFFDSKADSDVRPNRPDIIPL